MGCGKIFGPFSRGLNIVFRSLANVFVALYRRCVLSISRRKTKSRPRISRRRLRRIEPLEAGRTERKMVQKSDSFSIIFSVSLMFGMPLLPSERKKSKFLPFMWSAILVIIYTIMLAIELLTNYAFWDSVASRMCNIVTCAGGYLIMWLIILNNRRIVSMVQNIRDLSSALGCDLCKRKSAVKLYLYFCSSFIAGQIFTQVVFFMINYKDLSAKLNNFNPLPEDSAFYTASTIFLYLTHAYPFTFGAIVYFIALSLCATAFRDAGHLFALFGEKLATDLKSKRFTGDVATENIDTFKSIISCVRDTDETLNTYAMIIYLSIVNNVYSSLNMLISNENKLRNLMMESFGVTTLVEALVVFLYLTYSGDKIADESDQLKKKLAELSFLLFRQTPNTSSLLMYELMCQQIKNESPCATCMGLFTIKKTYILSVMGAILSYGVTLYQLGALNTD